MTEEDHLKAVIERIYDFCEHNAHTVHLDQGSGCNAKMAETEDRYVNFEDLREIFDQYYNPKAKK